MDISLFFSLTQNRYAHLKSNNINANLCQHAKVNLVNSELTRFKEDWVPTVEQFRGELFERNVDDMLNRGVLY